MNYFRTFLRRIVIGIVALISVGAALPVHAQATQYANMNAFFSGAPVLRGNGAISLTPAMLIRYIGTNSLGGTVTYATATLTLSIGAVGSSAGDATVICGGGGNGTILTSNGSCNTFGKVVDVINGSPNWVAVLVGVLRSDTSNTVLLAQSEAAANAPEGFQLLLDGTKSFNDSILISQQQDLTSYVADSASAVSRGRIKQNPFLGQQAIIFQTNETNTYGSGTSTYQILCALSTYAQTATRAGAESVVTTFATPGAATTVANSFTFANGNGFSCPTGYRMLSRVSNSAAMSAVVHYVAGRVWRPTAQ